MNKLLLVTPNPVAAAQIEKDAADCEMHTRIVSGFDAAKRWLEMQTFEIVLVDYVAEPIRGLEIIELAWKHSGMTIGGIFSVEQLPPDTWSATLIGAKVFLGPNALDRIGELLRSYPRDIQIAQPEHSAILLVEDLDSPRDIVRAYIEALGFPEVEAVGSAKAALETLHGAPRRFFCVVTDIHMPEMSGIKLTAAIRADRDLQHIPVIILTSDPTADNVIECIKAGASGFLAKPPKKASLLKEIEKAKRMILIHQQPRLCEPEDAHLLEEAAARIQSK